MIKEKEDKFDIFKFIKKDIWFDVKEEEKEDFKNFCNIAEIKQFSHVMMNFFFQSLGDIVDYPSFELQKNDNDCMDHCFPSSFKDCFLYSYATEEEVKTAINIAIWEAFYKTSDKNKAVILLANIDFDDYEKFAYEIIKKVKNQINDKKNQKMQRLQKIKTINKIHQDIDTFLNSHIDEVTERNDPIFYKYIKEQGKTDAFEILKNEMKMQKIDEITEENKDKLLKSVFDEMSTKIYEYKQISREYEENIRNVVCHNENLLDEIISKEKFLEIAEETKKKLDCDIKTNKEHFFKEVMKEVNYITNNPEQKIEDSTYTIICVSETPQDKDLFKDENHKEQNIKINKNSKKLLINTTALFKSCFQHSNKETRTDEEEILGLIKLVSDRIAKHIKINAGKDISQNKIIKIRFIGENMSRLIYTEYDDEWAAADLIESLLQKLLAESKDKKIIIIDDSSCCSNIGHVKDLLSRNGKRRERIAKFLLKPEIKDKIQDLYIGSTINTNQPEAEVMDKIKVDDKNKTIESAKYFNLIDERGILYTKKKKQDFYKQQYDSLITEPLRKEFEKDFKEGKINEYEFQKILTEVKGLDIEEARNKINEKIKQNNQEKNLNKVKENQNNESKEEISKKIKKEIENIKYQFKWLENLLPSITTQCINSSNTAEEAINKFHIQIAKQFLVDIKQNTEHIMGIAESFKQSQHCNYKDIVRQTFIKMLKEDYVKYIEDETISEKDIEQTVSSIEDKELKYIKKLKYIKNKIMFQILKKRFEPQLKEGLLDEQTIENSLKKNNKDETIAIFPEKIIIKQLLETQCDKLNKNFKTELQKKLITEEEIKEKILKSENIKQAEQSIKKSIEVQKKKKEVYKKYEQDIKDINIDKKTIDKAIELAKDNDKDIDDIIKKEIECNKENFPSLFEKFVNKLDKQEIKQILIESGNQIVASNNIQQKITQNQIENEFKKEIEEGILDSDFIIKQIKENRDKDAPIIVKTIKDKIKIIEPIVHDLMEEFKISIENKIIDEKQIYKIILNNYNNEDKKKLTEDSRTVIDNIITYTMGCLCEFRRLISKYFSSKEVKEIELKVIKSTNNLIKAKEDFKTIMDKKERLYLKYYNDDCISHDQLIKIVLQYDTIEEIEKHILDRINCNKLIDLYKLEKYISGYRIKRIFEESGNNVATANQNIEDEINKNKELSKTLLEEYKEEINKNTIEESLIFEKVSSNIKDLKIIRRSINEYILRQEFNQLRPNYEQYGIDFIDYNISEITTDDLKNSRAYMFYMLLKTIEEQTNRTDLSGISTCDVENIGRKYINFEKFHKAIVNYSLLEKMKRYYADVIGQKLIDIETIEKIIQDTEPKRSYTIMEKIQLSVAKIMFKNEIEKRLITEKELEMHTRAPIDQYNVNRKEVSFNPIKLNIIRQIIANQYVQSRYLNEFVVELTKKFDPNKTVQENIKEAKKEYTKITKENKKTYKKLIEKYKKEIADKNISKEEIKNIIKTKWTKWKKKEYDQIVVMIDKNISENKKTRKIQQSLKNLYAQKEMEFWNTFRKDLKTRPQINKMQQKKSRSK